MTKAELIYELRHYPDNMEVFLCLPDSAIAPLQRITKADGFACNEEGDEVAHSKVLIVE